MSIASTLTATELKLRLVLITEVAYGFMVTSVHELQRIRHVVGEHLSFNVSVKLKLQHAPPRAFDTFAVPGRREFDYQSLPGGGEFDPHALGVGNLNCTLDFM